VSRLQDGGHLQFSLEKHTDWVNDIVLCNQNNHCKMTRALLLPVQPLLLIHLIHLSSTLRTPSGICVLRYYSEDLGSSGWGLRQHDLSPHGLRQGPGLCGDDHLTCGRLGRSGQLLLYLGHEPSCRRIRDKGRSCRSASFNPFIKKKKRNES